MKSIVILGCIFILSACSQFSVNTENKHSYKAFDQSYFAKTATVEHANHRLVSLNEPLSRDPNRYMEHRNADYQTTDYQAIKNKLLFEYANWKGTRYLFGGTTKSGIDCSALLQHIFNNQFDMQIPRTTAQQHKLGQQISKHQLQVGDLIFFKTSQIRRHVGVYLGNSKFLHASASRGVTITDINHQYWKTRYWKSKRVL